MRDTEHTTDTVGDTVHETDAEVSTGPPIGRSAPQLAKLAPREAIVVGHVRGWIRAEERRRSVDVEPVSPRRSTFSDQTGAAESAASAVEERPRPTTDRHADLGRRFVRPVERAVGGEAPHDEAANRVARARPLPARSRVDQPAPGEAAPSETSPAESSPPPVPTVAIASSTETPSSVHTPTAVATPVEGETKVARSERVWRRYEEWFWWAVCLLAVAAILWRVLA